MKQADTASWIAGRGLTQVPPAFRQSDRRLDRRHTAIERLLRRLKGDRRVFTRGEPLDVLFNAVIVVALIVAAIDLC